MEDLEPVFKKNEKTIKGGDQFLKADEIINGEGPINAPASDLGERPKAHLFDKTLEVSPR